MIKRTLDEHANSIAAYLPNDVTFEAKYIPESNFRQLIRGFSGDFQRIQDFLCTLEEEYFPDQTTLFIEEWERAVGIPDDCFTGVGTIEERRTDVVVKLASLGLQTAEDFENLALFYGITLTVDTGSGGAFPPYDVPFIPTTEALAGYTIVVTGPSITGPGKSETALRCIFQQQAPVNVTVIFVDS